MGFTCTVGSKFVFREKTIKKRNHTHCPRRRGSESRLINTGSAHTSKTQPEYSGGAGRGCDSWRRAGVPRGSGAGQPGAGSRRCRALTSGPGHSGAGDHIHACPRRLLLELQRGKEGGEEGRKGGSEKEKGEGRVKRGGEDGGSTGTCPATPGRNKRPRTGRCS